MRIFKEKAGTISLKPVWVAVGSGYLYTADTLPGLLWLMVRQWRHKRHIVD